MPVGTNFENSALKASFSLSSLPPSTGLENSEHVKIKNERLYNSLTKKRKDPKHENWRKSWGSNCDNKDDFWSALQANYDYIMDNHLIDSCQEIDRDIRTQAEETWTLNQLISHFSELCFFLNDIQDTVYGKAENVTNWALRTSHMEEMTRVSPRRKLFNDQANRLMEEMPGVQDEVSWRVSHLNSKWEQVENALSTNGCSRCEQESCPDIEHEVRCLRKWVKEMESRLQPLNFQLEWTIAELEKKALEHMVLQRDIENHSKIVSSVVRLCNRVGPRDAKCHASNARRVANGLERRYHLLFLRSLEWQCHIESLFKLHNNRCQDFSSDADSDEEPCMKQPRLSSDYVVYSSSNQYEDEDVSFTGTGMDINSESVSVKMVNNGNEHEREINNFEHKASTEDYQNHCENGNEMNTDMKYEHEEHKFGVPTSKGVQNLNSSGHEKSPKDKNTLQKLPISVEANIGSYYYKHRDTDSELDTNNSIISMFSNKDPKKEDSSEDEFTYCAKSMDAETIPETTNELPDPDKECIQRLVQRVEELVSTPKVDPLMFHTEQQKSKLSRVKEWLNFENDKPIDSCDASGECTSGESEEDKESQSSEDLNDSIVTCRPQQLYDSCLPLDDSHTEELAFTTEPCKVNLRPKRFQMKGNRPWSVSCLSQFSQISPTKQIPDALPNFSISESALNNLGGLTPNSVKMRPFNASANSIGIQGNNSTSSTVEESGVMYLNEGAKPISVRKKKIRLRKKHIVRKNESGSESQNYRSPGHTNLTSFSSKPHIYTLVKSGSFSGSGSRVVAHERNTASDPSTRPYNGSRGVCDTSTTSGADSEDDKKIQSRLPKFLLGPHAGLVKGFCAPILKAEDRDSSPEKSSLNTAEEQSSSLSEQAWDNYQEKYLSENYSEAHDSDAARRLLEFGEDYRCYLDSQSDCWSAHSQNHSPQFRRKATMIPQTDSDSEIEDIKQYINESKSQLKYTIDIYDKHVAMELNEFLVSSDCGEIIATCERHIYGLEVVIDANDDTKVLPDIEVMEVKALMSAWMDLKWSAKKMQSSRALYNEVISFKKDLSQYAVNASPLSEVKSKEELTAEIDRLTEVQNVLHDKKRRLLELNVAIHRYIINENTPCYTNLKSEVSDLYTLWNDTCQSVNERMNDLNGHLQVWAQLESRLDELQSDLRSDGQTLRLLDTALNGGVVSMEVASSVRDVAKVLSESKTGSQKYIDASGNQDVAAALFCNRTLSLSLLTEGSFSDSGISDEGSEQELSEREHRLAAIRRLVRHLETIMAPDSEARIKMTQRLEEAENELRKLQSQCRGLIVRTAVCAEVQSQNSNKSSTKRKFSCNLGLANGKDEFSVGEILCGALPDGGDPDNNPDSNGSWFWRVVRASVPFQVALVALICMACLLEPSCCDSINNLSLSLTPQLRYVRGPPPV